MSILLREQVVIAFGMKESTNMDLYLLKSDEERTNEYFRLMGKLEARSLSEEAIVASSYLINDKAKIDFRNNIAAFIEIQREVFDGNSSPEQKMQAIKYLKQEKVYLSEQIFNLKYKKIIKLISISIDSLSETLDPLMYYTLRGVGVVSGALQIISGVGLIGGSYATGPGAVVGNVAGGVLVIHGLGAIQENVTAVISRDRQYKGVLRHMYERAAENLGFTCTQGSIVYSGMDLVLSGYTLGRSVLLPDKERLYYYMYNDVIYGFKNMTTNALRIEIGIDGLTIKSMLELTNPSVSIVPFPLPPDSISPNYW